MEGLLGPTFSTVPGFPSLCINPHKVIEVTQAMMDGGVRYGLGCKVKDLAASPPSFITPEGQPCRQVDCSGFVRYCLLHATGGRTTLNDGSVCMHEQVDAAGFKKTDVANCAANDGHTRIVFLSPGYEGVGHVVLVPGDGKTCESHGGFGPNRRAWGSRPWMQATEYLTCYVLA